MYYKLINGQCIIGVATLDDFRKVQKKHGLVIFSGINDAEYVEKDGVLYRDDWLKAPSSTVTYTELDIVPIDEVEYNALRDALETKAELTVEEEPKEEDPAVEPDAELEYVRTQKIKAMSAACEAAIVAGFTATDNDGTAHHYSLEVTDQIMIAQLALKAQAGEAYLPWHADGEACRFYTADEMLALSKKMESLITFHQTYFNSLKMYINSMGTIAEIGEVAYGIDIPDEFRSEVLKAFMEAAKNDD